MGKKQFYRQMLPEWKTCSRILRSHPSTPPVLSSLLSARFTRQKLHSWESVSSFVVCMALSMIGTARVRMSRRTRKTIDMLGKIGIFFAFPLRTFANHENPFRKESIPPTSVVSLPCSASPLSFYLRHTAENKGEPNTYWIPNSIR